MWVARWSLLIGCLNSGWIVSYLASCGSNQKADVASPLANEAETDSIKNTNLFPQRLLNLPTLDDWPKDSRNVMDANMEYWRTRSRQATYRHFPFCGPLKGGTL